MPRSKRETDLTSCYQILVGLGYVQNRVLRTTIEADGDYLAYNIILIILFYMVSRQ